MLKDLSARQVANQLNVREFVTLCVSVENELKDQNGHDMSEDKLIVVIETPPTATRFIQCTELMTQEELDSARKERPDLIFRLATELPPEPVQEVKIINKGFTVHGMTLPHNLEEKIEELYKD